VDDRQARGERIWAAALALIGTRFRLHGRDAAGGLDCVGLAALALKQAGVALGPVPDRYALRGGEAAMMRDWLSAAGLIEVDLWNTGDVLLCAMGGGQWHVMIGGRGKAARGGSGQGGDAVIHAHAGLRRVVMTPCVPEPRPTGELASCWRVILCDSEGERRWRHWC